MSRCDYVWESDSRAVPYAVPYDWREVYLRPTKPILKIARRIMLALIG